MARKRKTQVVDEEAAQELIGKIQAEQKKLNAGEGRALRSTLRIGEHLLALQTLVKRGWGKQVKQLGMDRRVATRHVTVARWFLKEFGPQDGASAGEGGDETPESHLLDKLPAELLRLEQLARLTRDQLVQLADEMDLRKATRAAVTKAVQKLVGPAKTRQPKRAPGLPAVQKSLKKSLDLVTGQFESGRPDEREQLTTVVTGWLRQFQETLHEESPNIVSASPPEVTAEPPPLLELLAS
jgi:hypothetical protein